MQASMPGAFCAYGPSEELEQNLLSLLRASPHQKNAKKNQNFCGSRCSDVQLRFHDLQKSNSQEYCQPDTSLYLIWASLCAVNSVLFFHLSFKQRFGKQEQKPKPNWIQRDDHFSFFMLTLMDVTKFLSQPSQSQ